MDFLYLAISEAQKAARKGEIPIGAVIVRGDKIIATAYNKRERKQNALAHAEVLAINKACRRLRSWRLDDCVMYVTLEPCPMCAGAIVQARIPVVIFGAKSPKAGCAGSILNLLDEPRFNHRAEIISGICEDECASLMSEFMRTLRTASYNC